jgi:hypothetical protein
MDSIGIMYDWMEGLVAKKLTPYVITVAESAGGYLPPQSLSIVEEVAETSAKIFGCHDLHWIECSACVELEIENELEVDLDLFVIVDGEYHRPEFLDVLIPARSCLEHENFANNILIMKAFGIEADQQLSYIIPAGNETQRVALSSWVDGFQSVLTIRPL